MNDSKINIISYRFRLLFQCLLFLAPLFVCLNWSNFNFWLQFANVDPEPFGTPIHSLTLSSRFGAILISFIPAGMWMMALYYLIKLFKLYERNQIFTANNVIFIKKIGCALFAEVMARFLLEPFLSLIVTMHNPPGHRMMVVSFGTPDFAGLMFSGIVILVAWIMQEGQKLKEESEFVV